MRASSIPGRRSSAWRNSTQKPSSPRVWSSTCCSVPPTKASSLPRGRRWPWRAKAATCRSHSIARRQKITEKGGISSAGRVLIVDDVLTAGTAVRESFDIIEGHGAIVAGVVISLDRMERGQGGLSAVREIEKQHGVPVISIATLDDLMSWLEDRAEFRQNLNAIAEYRELYGVVDQT